MREVRQRTYRLIFRRGVEMVCEATGEREGTDEYEYVTALLTIALPMTDWQEKWGMEFEVIGAERIPEAAGEGKDA